MKDEIERISERIMHAKKYRATTPSDISTAAHYEFLRVYEVLADLARVAQDQERRISSLGTIGEVTHDQAPPRSTGDHLEGHRGFGDLR